MIAADTNILVRLIVEDDPAQAFRAKELLENAAAAGEQCFIGDPVLCELEWVLGSCYDIPRADILATVQNLASLPLFVFEDKASLALALEAYQKGKADFSDYLIGEKARSRGVRTTYTFDRALRDQEGFTVVRG